MIILSIEAVEGLYEASTNTFNWDPKAGDNSHVADHETIARVVRDSPVVTSDIGFKVFMKSGGDWVSMGLDEFFRPSGNTSPSAWVEVVATARPGVLFAAEGDEADGVTDYTDDVFPDGFAIYAFYCGVKGITDLLAKATTRIGQLYTGYESLTSRVEALENAAG